MAGINLNDGLGLNLNERVGMDVNQGVKGIEKRTKHELLDEFEKGFFFEEEKNALKGIFLYFKPKVEDAYYNMDLIAQDSPEHQNLNAYIYYDNLVSSWKKVIEYIGDIDEILEKNTLSSNEKTGLGLMFNIVFGLYKEKYRYSFGKEIKERIKLKVGKLFKEDVYISNAGEKIITLKNLQRKIK